MTYPKVSENKLKTNSIIVNTFYNIQYNSEPPREVQPTTRNKKKTE
jgi:hypothetical protein